MTVVRNFAAGGVLLFACSIASTQQKVQHIQTSSPIASAVWVGDTLYVSGQMASPIAAADPAKGTPAVYGDTEAQSMSALTKIQALLKDQGSPWATS